jgi:hypothetical protein
MPEAGVTDQSMTGRAASPLPVSARQRLWDAVWDRLLAPATDGRQEGDGPDWVDAVDGGRLVPVAAGRRRGEAS